jgi:hypothetical protein
MKIALLILILLIIILIIFYFQYKPIEKFKNSRCVSTTEQLENLNIRKNNIKSISDIIDDIYNIARRLNDNSTEKMSLDNTPTTNTELYNQALERYNTSSIKKMLNLITDDKTIINNYYTNVLENYNNQNINCR